jgi:hypothetical protein
MRKYSDISETLLILPCNDGVIYGNYYKGGRGSNNWTSARKNAPTKQDIYIAAVDCGPALIPTLKDNPEKGIKRGCLVFEDEMYRVLTDWDLGPPTYAITSYEKLILLTKAIEIGLKRATDPDEYGFKRLVAVVPVFWYRVALIKAVDNLKLWDITTVFDTCMCGYGRMLASHADILPKFPPGLIRGIFSRLPEHTNIKSRRNGEVKKVITHPKDEAMSEKHKWYRRLPPAYQYVSYAPIPDYPKELHDAVVTDWREKRTNWRSFFTEDVEEDSLVG